MKKLYLAPLVLLFFGACTKSPQTYESLKVDTFVVDNVDNYSTPSKILQADYMFLVDASASMDWNSADPDDPYASKREQFVGAIDQFSAALKSQNIDYKFGFVEGNVNAYRTSELSGRTFFKDILVTSQMSTTTRNSFLDRLQAIGQTLNANSNVILEAADQVMGRVKSTFVRPGSQLVYIFVSDTDDESPHPSLFGYKDTSESTYASRLIAHKGAGDEIPGFVNARAVVTGVFGSGVCEPDENTYSERAGFRLAETARIIEQRNRRVSNPTASVSTAQVSKCILRASSEFDLLLGDLARNISKPTTVFQLQVKNVDESSIQVYKNGVRQTSGWTYNRSSNSIEFTTAPDFSSSISIRYNQFFTLSKTPSDIASVKVSINGQLSQFDATNGWSYDPITNRIMFNGNAANLSPATRIEVQYQ